MKLDTRRADDINSSIEAQLELIQDLVDMADAGNYKARLAAYTEFQVELSAISILRALGLPVSCEVDCNLDRLAAVISNLGNNSIVSEHESYVMLLLFRLNDLRMKGGLPN